MNKLFTLLSLFFSSVCFSQIGIVSLDANSKTVPLNMWYSIDQKSRKNQMYWTTDDVEIAGEILREVVFDIGLSPEDIKIDNDGEPFWQSNLGNGYLTQVHMEQVGDLFNVVIITLEISKVSDLTKK